MKRRSGNEKKVTLTLEMVKDQFNIPGLFEAREKKAEEK